MKTFAITAGTMLALMTVAHAADLPRPQPVYEQPAFGKAPIGKGPIGKGPVGKGPVAPVVPPPVVRRGY